MVSSGEMVAEKSNSISVSGSNAPEPLSILGSPICNVNELDGPSRMRPGSYLQGTDGLEEREVLILDQFAWLQRYNLWLVPAGKGPGNSHLKQRCEIVRLYH